MLSDEPQLGGIPATLARSLAIFQLGESGGGTVVEQARRSRLPSAGEDYAEAVALFVAEEHGMRSFWPAASVRCAAGFSTGTGRRGFSSAADGSWDCG